MSQSSPFDFNPSGKTNSPSRIRPATASKQSPLIQLTVIGAWICLVYAPLSQNWFARFTVGNTLINLFAVGLFALIPLAVLWRIRNEAPLSPTQQYVGVAAVGLTVVLTLAIWFGTGFLGSANWHTWWCSFLGRCAVAAVILWFPRFSTKTPLPLVVVGVFALLMIVSFIIRGWAFTMPTVSWSGYAGFKNLLILISLVEKLLITSVVAGFIATRWGQSPQAASEAIEQPSHGLPSSFGTFLSSVSDSAGAAATIVSRQTERTKLTTMTMPAAYRALGKDCVQQKRHLESVPELIQQLRSVIGELKALSDAATAQPAAQSLTDKAKAAGKQAADFARQKQLGMKRDALIADIGKSIHDQHGDTSGPEALVTPIRDALALIPQLDADISRLSEVGKGSLLTPKRLLIGGGIAAVVLVGMVTLSVGSWMLGAGTGSTQSEAGGGIVERVLAANSDLFTKHKMKKPAAIAKKYPPGSVRDFLQAIELLGGNTYVSTWQGETSCTPNCQIPIPVWNAIFGDINGLLAPADNRAMTSNWHVNATWHATLTDGSVVVKCDPIFGVVHVGKIILY